MGRPMAGWLTMSFLLVSCGPGGSPPPGGNSGTGGTPSSRALRGALIDSPVAGVSFETATLAGVTDSEGSFLYEPGETVVFSLGDTVIGEVAGQPEVTPFDLVPGSTAITGTQRLVEALQDASSPFARVLNLTVFLQSLDVDDDPSNGIEVPSSLATLFAGVSIDFSLPPRIFSQAFALREVLARANAQSVFAEPRAVVDAARAMQHLYETLGVDPRIFYPKTIAADGGADGSIDSNTFLSYDDAGRLVSRESDSSGPQGAGPDGTPDQVERWTYDANGNMLSYTRDGTPARVTTWSYDPTGNVTSEILDTDEDGDPERAERWTYDGNGSAVRYERDDEGDGVANLTAVSKYDDDGNEVRRESDFNGDGNTEWVETWEYDGRGNVIRAVLDSNNDGNPNRIETSEYDSSDRPVRRAIDFGGDGAYDSVESFEYDEAGDLIRRKRDDGNDGVPDFIETFTYDADGHETRREADEGADGIAVAVFERTYDSDGRPTLAESDLDGDGDVDSSTSWTYDARGNLLRFESDSSRGLRIETAMYDLDDNQRRFQRQTTETGITNQVRTRTFESQSWGLVMFLGFVKTYDLVLNF
jgi:YD repeat-containing protein